MRTHRKTLRGYLSDPVNLMNPHSGLGPTGHLQPHLNFPPAGLELLDLA